MSSAETLSHAEKDPDSWERLLHDTCSETSYPGYWDNLKDSCDQWAREVSICPLWNEGAQSLKEWSAEYRDMHGGELLLPGGLPKFVGKGLPRIKEKIKSKLMDDPSAIKNLYQTNNPIPALKDLVRTRIPCRFMDGVEFLASKLSNLAVEHNANPERSREGKLEGYFAQHLTFRTPVIFRFGGVHRKVYITCEVQIATELATRIWEATHAIYEEARVTKDEPDEWQWSPSDPRFVSRQLGHMIHLADGLLVQLRDTVNIRQQQRKAPSAL